MKIKKMMKKYYSYDNFFSRFFKYIYFFIKRNDYIQKRKKYGNLNDDKIIYVIRPSTNDCIQGLMSLFVQNMIRLDYAMRKGYIPFIDYKNYKTQYSDGKNNIWEYFFSQPSNLKIEDVYKSKNVILSGTTIRKIFDPSLFDSKLFFDEKICKKWHTIFCQNISISDEVLKRVELENKNIDVENCIGVYIRGTDYVNLKPVGEFVQPSIESVINKIEEFSNKYPKHNIFLVTEDKKNYDKIKEKFYSKMKIVSFDNFIDQYDSSKYLSRCGVLKEDKKERGMEYLVKIVLLSRCKYLISSITSGSVAAYVMNGNKYIDKYIFELGKYK